MPIIIRLDALLAERKMTARELAQRIDITEANLSILKNGHAKALEAICRELNCQPGDLLGYEQER